jgi:glycosyltransferase involved in cell wall biosynthesis
MLRILYLDEKHGVIFPRSNNASIASVPLLPLDVDGVDEDRALRIWQSLKENVPRYAITPVAVGFCFLVRRQLIKNYGFFDTIYSPGYSEENDFCLRVNKFGYSSVMANKALVFHEGSRSFEDAKRIKLQRRNEKLMFERYTYYRHAVAHYLQFAVDPFDWFADRLFSGDRPRVLIDLYHMSLIYNGSTRNALTFLDLLKADSAAIDIEFVIVSSAEAIDFFDLDSYGFRVVANGNLEETFDLGFSLSPVSSPIQLNVLNRHCVRWVVSHFDVIALRINSLLEVSYTRKQVVLDALVWADRVIPISDSALDDLESYFGAPAASVRAHSTVIHEGVAETSFVSKAELESSDVLNPEQRAAIEKGGYVLIVGNIFTHKQLPEAITALQGLGVPVLAFGALADKSVLGDAMLIEGGLLSDSDIDQLYRKAGCVVFPSNYEGFGLPIVETGQRGRPLVLFESKVAREVVNYFELDDLTTFFTRFDELRDVVLAALSSPAATSGTDRELRPLALYNRGILDVLLDELAKPVDLEKLRTRVDYFRAIEIYGDALEKRLHDNADLIRAIRSNRSYRVTQKIVRVLEPLRPLVRVANGVRLRLRGPSPEADVG